MDVYTRMLYVCVSYICVKYINLSTFTTLIILLV